MKSVTCESCYAKGKWVLSMSISNPSSSILSKLAQLHQNMEDVHNATRLCAPSLPRRMDNAFSHSEI